MTICDPCLDITCTDPIPTCADYLNLGVIQDAESLDVIIYSRYFIDGSPVITAQYREIESYTGEVVMDLTEPAKEYFNQYNGLYEIWVTDLSGEMFDMLTLTKDTIDSVCYGVTFKKVHNLDVSIIDINPQ